ncbi:MAG TPA: NAD(P)/FAD-dependent oxidoreductase [Solirubrobacterales bacterium]|nr:NAD(P)/FAD-dependent oxidoreductase [Solirubrobacterales bacterium]
MSEAIVVGSGPNGLACAATLASAGVAVTVIEAEETIGGGTRSAELTLPGLIHDVCSAGHPMAIGSPALAALEIERRGFDWALPEVDVAHPLDGGGGAAIVHSIEQTAAGLGEDGGAWRRVFGPSAKHFDALREDIMQPVLRVPHHPLRLTSFGLRSMAPATVLARSFRSAQTRALFGGVAAHGFAPLNRPFSSAVAMAMISAGHRYGWPVARGGSQSIADVLAAIVLEHGGRIETGRPVRSLAELPAADAVVLDLAPGAVVELAGGRLPRGVDRAYRRYRHGPAAFKLDLAVEGGVPWTHEDSRRAGTVHAIGSFEETVLAEREVNRGRMPASPFVLVCQQYLADPSRSQGDLHPVWAYAHVPSGYDGDATEPLLDQIERFAPGFRERIVARVATTPAQMTEHNANFIGGDVITGANTPWQLLFRPRFARNPYETGIPGVYICSAATPPGAGAHGMGGYNAAQSVLRTLGSG